MSETVGRAPGIELTPCGARVPTVYQKLVGIITQEGLRLDSAESTPDSLRLRAHSIGREGGLTPLPPTGEVSVSETYVVWSRPGLNEEFSATQDGLRQDFVIHTAPDRTGGPLWVELDLCGAKAKLADWGASLILNGSGRELSYSKLLVNDASGRIIPARIEVPAADRIRIVVDDADAVYPLRIDPTFSDADWITLNPTIPGTNATISALAINPLNGDVVVGGDFGYAGGASTGYIVKWNGGEWSPLGAGIGNGSVKALCFDSTGTLYAGGFFTSAGGIPAKYIAKWNGSSWSNLGSGMSSSVYSLTCDAAGNLYAGGSFTTAGGVTVNGVAKWNGSTWSALGSGMSGGSFGVVVNALVCDAGGNLYAGGDFATAGGLTAKCIAKWNGTTWSALGTGMDAPVSALAIDTAGNLFAGGRFLKAGGVTVRGISKWNGSAWSALGSGMQTDNPSFAAGTVHALSFDTGGNLHAGGNFLTAGGVTTNHIAKWNGTTWSDLATGMDSLVYALACDSGGNLYAAGDFTKAGGVGVSRVAKWNGGSWSALGSGMNGPVRAVACDRNGSVYVGGEFTTAGGVGANYIAKWNGSAWSVLGSGTNGPVNALAIDSQGQLFAGGSFTKAGGLDANRIAKWNGSTWIPLGSGLGSGDVHSLVFDASGNLFVGGGFFSAGEVIVNSIARWNGSAWSVLGSGMNGFVYALACDSTGNLFAGGTFTNAGGVAANHIAKWNGTTWSALGQGTASWIRALAFDPAGNLFAGGDFTYAGGAVANHIARWNGSSWSPLGSGMNGPVHALRFDSGGDLLVAGDFFNAGAVTARSVARWSGNSWSAAGSIYGGPNDSAYALAFDPSGKIYVGGRFTTAGAVLSHYIAMAVPSDGTPFVTTPVSSGITTRTATLGGNVENDRGKSITERGIVYSKTSLNADPTIGATGVTKLASAGTTGIFTIPIAGLQAGTGYSFRAYATNSAGTSYSAVAAFSTLDQVAAGLEISPDLQNWQAFQVTPSMIDSNGKLIVSIENVSKRHRMRFRLLDSVVIQQLPSAVSTIGLEQSSDLQNWQALPITSEMIDANGNLALLKQEPSPAQQGGKRFYRTRLAVLMENITMIQVDAGVLPETSQLGPQAVSAFSICRTEVTWSEWQTVRTWAAANGYDIGSVGAGEGPNRPVTNVSWYHVLKWCNARSEKEGLTPVYKVGTAVYRTGDSVPTFDAAANGYRLPSEKEWEFAARGGVKTNGYEYSGSNDINAVGWYGGNSGGSTQDVATKQANELGITDMTGNVFEWCFDNRNVDYKQVRGGYWGSPASACGVTYRSNIGFPTYTYFDVGFRVARSQTMIHVEAGTLPASSQLGAQAVSAFSIRKTEVTLIE